MNKFFLMAVTVIIVTTTSPVFAYDGVTKPETIKFSEQKTKEIDTHNKKNCDKKKTILNKTNYNKRNEKSYYGRYEYEDIRDKTEALPENLAVERIENNPSLTIGYEVFENTPDTVIGNKIRKRHSSYRSMIEKDDRTAGTMPVIDSNKRHEH